MKVTLGIIFSILAALALWFFSGEKWSGYRWNQYVLDKGCIPAAVPGGKGSNRNVLELAGEAETVAYVHRLSIWRCTDGKLLAIYEGLPDVAPAKLANKDALRFRHGFLAGDDSRRFISMDELPKLKTISDWAGLVAGRPL